MDLPKLIILTLFTLTLAINLQVHCVEGSRHLKQHIDHKNNPANKTVINGERSHETGYASEAVYTQPITPKPPSETLIGSKPLPQMQPPPHGVEDFRPTAPGHSPGAGHSIQN
ncbi:hypothetical protein SSX86_014405 [Deinandra increscens subsp. villosa]|uniref:Uncharacterized protein n=1 Tax=Deinandra increscens subsp. villosa TaxID=3103831 RepID=A0AAP0GZC7_9ASTR